MLEATLNCYIWVVGAIPNKQNLYPLKDIFFYNSLEDRTFSHQNDLSSYSFEVQIPEIVIGKLDKNISEYVYNNKQQIVNSKQPMLKHFNGKWEYIW